MKKENLIQKKKDFYGLSISPLIMTKVSSKRSKSALNYSTIPQDDELEKIQQTKNEIQQERKKT